MPLQYRASDGKLLYQKYGKDHGRLLGGCCCHGIDWVCGDCDEYYTITIDEEPSDPPGTVFPWMDAFVVGPKTVSDDCCVWNGSKLVECPDPVDNFFVTVQLRVCGKIGSPQGPETNPPVSLPAMSFAVEVQSKRDCNDPASDKYYWRKLDPSKPCSATGEYDQWYGERVGGAQFDNLFTCVVS